MTGLLPWYDTKAEAIAAAREAGYTLFGRDSDGHLLVGAVWAVKTFGAVGHEAGASDIMLTLVVHRNTGYADWRPIPLLDN